MNQQIEPGTSLAVVKSIDREYPKTGSTIKQTPRNTLNLDEETEVNIQWVLQDFSLKPPETFIHSPEFPSGYIHNQKWTLRLIPKILKTM